MEDPLLEFPWEVFPGCADISVSTVWGGVKTSGGHASCMRVTGHSLLGVPVYFRTDLFGGTHVPWHVVEVEGQPVESVLFPPCWSQGLN